MLIGVFDDDAETHFAGIVVDVAEYPGRFISAITSARSAGAKLTTSTAAAVGTGLPSSERTVKR
jgi:hypothetical protein